MGDFLLREMYAQLKEVRAQRGVCLTAGSFSSEAQAFVEARLIDLIDKAGLIKQFAQLGAANQ